jgi:hypothetical protein
MKEGKETRSVVKAAQKNDGVYEMEDMKFNYSIIRALEYDY